MGCCASCFGASAPAQSVQLATPVERGCLHARACSGAINLNTCSAADLQSVPGIGRVLADRIVKARPFTVPTTADCVLGVRGIGRVTVGKLQPHLCPCFGGPPAAVGAAACVRTSDVRINAGPRYLAPPVAVTKRSLAAGVVTSHTWHEQLLFGDLSPAQAATPEFNVRHSTSDASGASSILLASWNIRNLSVGRQDLNLAVVARLMSQFDVSVACVVLAFCEQPMSRPPRMLLQVVSLQEVRDTTIVESLLQALNACSAMPVWRYIVSGPVTLVSPDTQPTAPARGSSSGAGTTEAAHRTTCHTELYAVFWQDHRVERLDNPRSRFGGLHRCAAASVLFCPHGFSAVSCNRFSREPFFCAFRCRVPSGAGTAFDFVLASIHVVFASGDTARRRADIRTLHRLVAAMIEVGVDQDVILAGGTMRT